MHSLQALLLTNATPLNTKVSVQRSQPPFPPLHRCSIPHAWISSSAVSACSVEPGSAADIGAILRILGSTSTPFAVKGGGHALNHGFSSICGVQISMTHLDDIQIHNTVDVGAGLTWDQIYATLIPLGLTVVGGRISTVGVAGLTLGGGYSFLSSRYGLTVDNMAGFELVAQIQTLHRRTKTCGSRSGKEETTLAL
ncbi:hypothetical protein BGW80DRAFT_368239 [Lactifluus volemus]|nr:hypothetical protein BGW80DRAFT_368239 [Lactifluus volemus]